jgi:hypothetical protein
MRLNAARRLPRLIATVILLLAAGSALVGQQQIVQCADPPGGTITCERGQLASCTVTKGRVEGRCQTPPSNLVQKNDVDAWILSTVTSRPVEPAETKRAELQDILKKGRWEKDDKIVNFNSNYVYSTPKKPF